MTLHDYIQSFPKAQRAQIRKEIANYLDISEVYVRCMSSGNKKILGKYALKLERISNGAISRTETSPELYPSNL